MEAVRPDFSVSTPEPRPHRPRILAFITLPLAVVPIVLALLPHDSGFMFFLAFGSICVATPCVGFWIGEMTANSQEGKAGYGCLASVGLFILYAVWALLIAPRIRP